uniref:RNA exonuclease 4 n=1 Tax=Globisporangium ultimum (strain ATCC 200006 / CBS 805.95 / DAOM BR144) TaxID=431595 RepID=K3WDF0_GLOUD
MAGKRKLGNASGDAAKQPNGGKKHKRNGVKKPALAAAAAAPALKKVAIQANSNWLALKANIQKKDQKHGAKKHDLDMHAHKQKARVMKQEQRKQQKTAEWIDNAQILAMDCEMVGVGLSGKTSVLARCSIVDYDGNVVYDKHVRPVEKVTDFRTHVSGIRSHTLKNAIPFAQCLKEVGKIMKDKIIVGHALKNDFQALMFTPPKNMIRDTARYRPYMRRKMNGTKLYPKSLKNLAEEVLGLQIQSGEHDSVEDARATLQLYKNEQFAWEKYLRSTKNPGSLAGVAPALPRAAEKPKQSAELKKALDLSDDEGFSDDGEESAELKKSSKLLVPDAKELAIMEYGE